MVLAFLSSRVALCVIPPTGETLCSSIRYSVLKIFSDGHRAQDIYLADVINMPCHISSTSSYVQVHTPRPSWLSPFTHSYCIICGPSVLQNSHLAPRPPSQAYASTTVMLASSPGPTYCVTLSPQLAATTTAVPPVWSKSTCFPVVHDGNPAPGSSSVTRPPQARRMARTTAGARVSPAGPKMAGRSAPCEA